MAEGGHQIVVGSWPFHLTANEIKSTRALSRKRDHLHISRNDLVVKIFLSDL